MSYQFRAPNSALRIPHSPLTPDTCSFYYYLSGNGKSQSPDRRDAAEWRTGSKCDLCRVGILKLWDDQEGVNRTRHGIIENTEETRLISRQGVPTFSKPDRLCSPREAMVSGLKPGSKVFLCALAALRETPYSFECFRRLLLSLANYSASSAALRATKSWLFPYF